LWVFHCQSFFVLVFDTSKKNDINCQKNTTLRMREVVQVYHYFKLKLCALTYFKPKLIVKFNPLNYEK
jgi:hypothetical protein